MEIPRAGSVSLAVIATATTALGVWWYAVGTAQAPGMMQYAAVAGGTSVLGGFIVWHRPGNRYGHAHLAIGTLFGSMVLATGALASAVLPQWVDRVALAWVWLSLTALLPLWVVVIATFPDGTFHRPVVRRTTVAIAVVMGLLSTAGYLLFPGARPLPLIRLTTSPELAGPLAGAGAAGAYDLVSAAGAVLGTVAPMLALVALGDRYRRAGVVVRQQIKWLLAGAAISVLLQAIPVQGIDSESLRTVAGVLVVLAVPLPLVAAAVAIFKYGLWDIDVVISHGLVYALVSGVLSVTFLLLALAVGLTVGGADAQVLAAVGLALLVSYLARPLRHRLVSLVTRALYGDEPRGLLALARLGEHRGNPSDARAQGARIAEVARTALGAPWAQVWLYLAADESGALRPLAGSGAEPGPPVVVPSGAVGALTDLAGGGLLAQIPPDAAEVLAPLLNDGADVVAALVVKGHLLGLVACGARKPDPYREEDVELLAVLGRESALTLQNIHLEGELRQRLTQIEQQAAELHRSRKRLVTAQDQERRRIERDLHDGAQQQLVALAARLRRAAHGTHGTPTDELTELADEAEDAVFTLQELARGIYPSLLADRGLHAALQAHAARVPVHVRIEVGPALHGHRLSPELEAVFYYVALEGMTNSVKHAPGAEITVLLRSDERTRVVVLEVHDDGPGFDVGSTSGSGLQNMADRVEAVDGSFSVDSAPGAGTWIRAEVRQQATVTALRTEEASP